MIPSYNKYIPSSGYYIATSSFSSVSKFLFPRFSFPFISISLTALSRSESGVDLDVGLLWWLDWGPGLGQHDNPWTPDLGASFRFPELDECHEPPTTWTLPLVTTNNKCQGQEVQGTGRTKYSSVSIVCFGRPVDRHTEQRTTIPIHHPRWSIEEHRMQIQTNSHNCPILPGVLNCPR